MNLRESKFAPAIVSALLALALFSVTLGGTYIYDDVAVIETDKRLKDPSQWWRYWKESYNQGVDNLYRPLVSMTYAIQWWLHGDRPWAFHLVNVLLHAGVSAGVAELAQRLAGRRAAWISGLLFAAHPIHVEDVANIVGRAELMCALGVVGASVLLLKPMTLPRAAAITGCFILALLSKEQGMLLPLLLLILWLACRYFGPTVEPGDRRAMRVLIASLCWLLAGYIVWRESILKFWWERNFIDWTINPMVQSQWHPYGGSIGRDRWLMPAALLGRYTSLLIAPIKLSPDYGAKVIGWSVQLSDPYLYFGFAAIVGWFIVFVFSLWKRSAAGVFAALGLALTYGMIGNIVTIIGTNFAERLMYLPSVFFVMLVALAASKVPRRVLAIFTVLVLILASTRSFTYALRWNDELVFYKTSLDEQPKSIRLYMLLASEYTARGDLGAAERVVRTGTEFLPEYWEIWVHSGQVKMLQCRFDEAHADFDRAGNIRPSMKIQAFMEENEKRRKAATTQP